MKKVRVRSYTRRTPYVQRRRRFSENLGAIIDEVKSGQRSGYTWTSGWRFDVNDPVAMEHIYDKLMGRKMYVVAVTNRKLEDLWAIPHWRISSVEGIGLWRDDDGTIYADDVVLFFGPKVSAEWANSYAKRHGQRFLLEVDGRNRTFAFVPVV